MNLDKELDYIIRSNPAVVVGHDEESMRPENIQNMIDQILKAVERDKEQMLERIINNGHGGGNWRRLLHQELSAFKQLSEEK